MQKPMMENGGSRKLTCTIPEAGALLGIGRASAYLAAQRGDIPTIAIGARRVVPLARLHRLLDGETTAGRAS